MTEVDIGEDKRQIWASIANIIGGGSNLEKTYHSNQTNVDFHYAVTAYHSALRETVIYMQKLKETDQRVNDTKQQELADLWSKASEKMVKFDPQLANRCFIKGQGWLDPTVWNDPRYTEYKVSIDDMREALMQLNEKIFAERNPNQGVVRRKRFLASSSELEEDRRAFESFVNRKNTRIIDKGVFIHLVIWEDFLDALSKTRLQDEYNNEIRTCEMFVMLFWTKV
jgi:hypothetical protein